MFYNIISKDTSDRFGYFADFKQKELFFTLQHNYLEKSNLILAVPVS